MRSRKYDDDDDDDDCMVMIVYSQERSVIDDGLSTKIYSVERKTLDEDKMRRCRDTERKKKFVNTTSSDYDALEVSHNEDGKVGGWMDVCT